MNNREIYASKHFKKEINSIVAREITESVTNDCISCKKSHYISDNLVINIKTIGFNIDLLEIKINRCQLKLFGCSNSKRKPIKIINSTLKLQILKKERNGKLKCKDAWNIAEMMNIKKNHVSAACETLGIRISSCQLGAF